MYTYDEWRNIVLHIQTGREGIKMLKERGITNTMTKEEYEKHMTSYRKIKQLQEERFFDILKKAGCRNWE